jgi:hypothetical protein
MVNVELTEDELNTLLQGLFLLEDQYWFKGKDKTNVLIKKLNEQIEVKSNSTTTICDI